MSEDWLDIINDDNAADQDADHIVLPPPQTEDIDKNGTIQKEISYRFDDTNLENIIRTERIFEIVNTKKRVSNAAINRRKYWIKFGECKDTPKGKTERGVTNQRDGNFPFQWNGKNMQTKQPIKQDISSKTKINREEKSNMNEEKKDNISSSSLTTTGPRTLSGAVYKPKFLSSSVFDEDDKVEIKISNLPQWSEFMNVKHLIDEFYKKHLNQRYIPKYRIRMIPSKRTLQQWHDDPKTYAHRLNDYERLAIVEFENEKSAQKAIKLLDGHHYDSHILRVEKAKPRMR